MAWIASVFWNAEQDRLRAFWRLPVFVVLLLMSQLIAGIMIVIVGSVAALISDGITTESIANLQTITDNALFAPVLQVIGLVCTVGSVWLAGRLLDRRKFVDFGFRFNRNWWIDFGFGLFLGAILMAIIFGVELATGWVKITGTFATPQGNSFGVAILLVLLTFVIVGINEEITSRGYLLQNMAEGFNWKVLGSRWAIVIATILSSIIFGLLHLFNPNADAVSTFNIFLAGILLALGYILTGDLAIPIGLHITWNFFQGNVFGFPVSGLSVNTTSFIAIEQSGPVLWTGGAFGPEAGLVGVGAMVLGALLTVLWVYLRRGKVALHIPLAEAPKQSIAVQAEAVQA